MREPSPEGTVVFRSACPVASSLDILGDKWTLLVIRDLFGGACRYNDFLASPERITTNILADRLKLLESEGLISRAAYQQRPQRFEYQLTPMGRDLEPMLRALVTWNLTWIPDRAVRSRPENAGNHPWRLPSPMPPERGQAQSKGPVDIQRNGNGNRA